MRSRLLSIALMVLMMPALGCVASMEAKKKREECIKSIQARVESTAPEILRQVKVKAVISRPLPEVYEAAMPVLTREGRSTAVTPTPPKLSKDVRTFRIIYLDTEPIYHEQKPIRPEDSQTGGLNIYVTILLEARGFNATTVYFYPHNWLCSTIPEGLKEVVDANMIYRGRLFIHRLEAQTASQRTWTWLTK